MAIGRLRWAAKRAYLELVRRLPDHPERQIFATVRRGATGQPKVQAFTTALRSQDG